MTSVRAADISAARGHAPLRWRLAAIGVFVGLPLGAAALAISGLLRFVDASERADHADETARAIIHQLDRRPGATSKPFDDATLFLGSTSASLAQAELQALVAGRIEAAGGRLVQLQSLDRAEQDPPGRTAVEITFDVGNAGLLDVLHGIEAGLPILDVPRLDARVESAADPSGGTTDSLRVSMTVGGAWRVSPR